jgi:hypothetical protein
MADIMVLSQHLSGEDVFNSYMCQEWRRNDYVVTS